MSFYQQLQDQTIADRNHLMKAPIIDICRHKQITKEQYVYFLKQAYHHVKHTVPLLKACKKNLPAHYAWLAKALDEYIEEESGHELWILNDIEACGADKNRVINEKPCSDIEEMITFLYNRVEYGQPLALFGMIHVLEGTSVSIACEMAGLIRDTLKLPERAMTYLVSHGVLDQDHLKFFEVLMNKITDVNDQQQIIDSAHKVYSCYGSMLHHVNTPEGVAA